MIVTFLIWLNIFIHSVLWGNFFSAFLDKLIKKNKPNNDSVNDFFLSLFVGVVFIALFAQLFHFIYRFDIYAQAVLTIISVFFTFFRFKNIKNLLVNFYQKIKIQSTIFLFGAILIFFSLLVLSSDSPSFYDTDLYHAQTVKWAEYYPVVIGLGNLYSAFALNSTVFTLHALFSFHFISGQSMHAVSGFVILQFLLYCYWLGFSQHTSVKSVSLTRVFSGLLTLFFVFCPLFSELAASLTPDIIANIFGFLTFILIIQANDENKNSDSRLFKILLFATFAVSAKLSMIFMFCVPFLYWRFYLKNSRNFLIAVSILMIILVPYITKNVLFSGYLLYPFYWLDILHVDWKMSHQAIYEEMMWIRSWNRIPGEKFIEVMKKPLFEWMPIWYSSLKLEDKIFISLFPVTIFASIVKSFFSTKKAFFTAHKQYLILYILLITGTAVWFFGSPDPRFGYAFFITLQILLLALLGENFFSKLSQFFLRRVSLQNRQVYYIFVLILIIMLFFVKKTHQDKFLTVFKEHTLVPRDYDEYKMLPETRNGLVFYYTAKEDRMGYAAPLPSTPFLKNKFSLRGKDISDGFKYGF